MLETAAAADLEATPVQAIEPIEEIRKIMDDVVFSDEYAELERLEASLAPKLAKMRQERAAALGRIAELFASVPVAPTPESEKGLLKVKPGKKFMPGSPGWKAAQLAKSISPQPLSYDVETPYGGDLPNEHVIIESKKGSVFFFSGSGPYIARVVK